MRWTAARAPLGATWGTATARSAAGSSAARAAMKSTWGCEMGVLAASRRLPERTATRLPCRRMPETASEEAAETSPFISSNSSWSMAAVVLASTARASSRRRSSAWESTPWRNRLKRMNSSEKNNRYQSVRRKRKLLIIGGFRVGAQHVAFPAAGADQPAGAAAFEPRAQAFNVDVDDVGEGIEVLVPDLLRDLLAAHHAIFIEHQKFQQRVFLGGEADGLAGAGDGVAGGVEREIADAAHLRPQHFGAAQQGTQTGQQLLEVEGLGEIVVAAGIQAGTAVVYGADDYLAKPFDFK